MSRRKNGRNGGGEFAFLLMVVALVVIGTIVMVREYRELRTQQAIATPTPAATPPAPTQPDTQPEATNPTEKPKPEDGKSDDVWPNDPPDGAPSNPLFLAGRDLKGGVSSKAAEAIVQKYGAYAHLNDPFVSHGKWGDTYIWTWESQEKDWRMRLQYSESEVHHPGMGIIGIFYTQEHITYRKTLSK